MGRHAGSEVVAAVVPRADAADPRTARQGADTIAWLAGVEGIPAPSGSFWCDRETRSIHKSPSTRASDTPDRRADLWEWVQSVTDPFVG